MLKRLGSLSKEHKPKRKCTENILKLKTEKLTVKNQLISIFVQ